MKKNVGKIDKIARIGFAVVVAALYLAGQITGTAAIILGLAAVILAATSIVGTCPIYLGLGISTNKEK